MSSFWPNVIIVEKSKPGDQRNDARHQNVDENRPDISVYSWEQIITMIEERYINRRDCANSRLERFFSQFLMRANDQPNPLEL